MVVEGVITRMVRGGALVDILLESGEPAFVPLSEIPAKSMPKVRELLERGAMQQVRITQLDRASGTATASLQGLLEPEKKPKEPPPRFIPPAPPPPPAARPATPVPTSRTGASERARKQQEEILRRLRGT
jgi:predicted RNA-binding protein with RPS1 domain